jgi:hypothetical protein
MKSAKAVSNETTLEQRSNILGTPARLRYLGRGWNKFLHPATANVLLGW